jgi:two-component system chemotaxis sensor kinase CheA
MRVDEKVVDAYMNLVGELVTTRNAFDHIQHTMEQSGSLDKALIDSFKERCKRLTNISESLRQNAMMMRLVPLHSVFQKYPRMIRDLANKVGKKIEMSVVGAEIEIDKSTLEKISDPILHILRNSVDHGLELEKDRVSSGKDPTGKILLKAKNIGTGIQLEISDDGRGLDPEKIIAKAIANGIMTSAQASTITKEEIFNLIFLPGFSTAEKITEISGRGVGMDIVRSSILAAKGKFTINSEAGQGTTIVIELPLSAALSQTLLVELGSDAYAIPVDVIEKTLKIHSSRLKTVMGQSSIVYQDKVMPVTALSNLLWGKKTNEKNKLGAGDLKVLILGHREQRLGVIVDRIIRREEILVKPLPKGLGSHSMLAGASILGNGRTVLVIEASELFSQMT